MQWYWTAALVIYFTVLGIGFTLHLMFDGWGRGSTKSGWFSGLLFMVFWPLWLLLAPLVLLVDKLILDGFMR